MRLTGVYLSQKDDTGKDHPVSYFSRKLLLCEERYSTVDMVYIISLIERTSIYLLTEFADLAL